MAIHPLQVLKTELTTDPLARGYAGMNDTEAAADLNTVYRVVTIPTVTGQQVGEQLNESEYSLLLPAQQATINAMLLLPTINTQAGFYRAFLLARFAGGSATRTALLAAFQRTISRARELAELNGYDLVVVEVQHVTAARALP